MPGSDFDAPPKHGRRCLALLLVLLLEILAAETLGARPLAALPTSDAAEGQFLTFLNQERVNVGLPPMHRDGGLDTMAREWSATMAATETLQHRPDLLSQ